MAGIVRGGIYQQRYELSRRDRKLFGKSARAFRHGLTLRPINGAAMAPIQGTKDALAAGHFLLPRLGPEELSRLGTCAQRTLHTVGDTIFRKGDPGDSAMAVVRGRVKICTYSADGRELVLNIFGAGTLFGEIALLDGQPRTGDAVAIEDTELLLLERKRLMPFLAANPEIQTCLIAVLCQRVRQTSEHLEDALLRDAPSRVARGLLRLAAAFGKAEPDGIRLDIKLSQQQIGNLIGISRESINKHLGDWNRAGHLAIKGGLIMIRNRDALERIADLAI
jgi:CRP-like cAMP-binding protein